MIKKNRKIKKHTLKSIPDTQHVFINVQTIQRRKKNDKLTAPGEARGGTAGGAPKKLLRSKEKHTRNQM